MQRFRGIVVKGPFAAGSKSEHTATFLDTGDEQLHLRRAGGNPFADDVLDALVGQKLEMTGTRRGNLLIVTEWKAA